MGKQRDGNDDEGRGGPPSGPRVVRRPKGQRKRLDPELEGLAAGTDDRIRRPRRRRLQDNRPVRLIPGVKNSDAREVFSARLDAMKEARASYPDDEAQSARLALLLAEALALGIHRGGSITGFDVLCEQLLDLPADEARPLAEKTAAEMRIPLGEIHDEAIATWLRLEAAFVIDEYAGRARVIRGADGELKLHVELPVEDAARALTDAGRILGPLADDL